MKFKKFKIGELFDIHPTKSYGITNYKLFDSVGKTPVVVNSSQNNGIGGYVDREPTEKGNMITFSDTTTSDSIFYQPYDFIGYSHVQGLYARPELNLKWTEKSLLYFLSLFRKCAKNKFDYANKFNRKIAAEMEILLPVNDNEEIDFDFMEERIKELMEERIKELMEERIKELMAYLKVTGLSDYELTDYEKDLIERFNRKIYKSLRIPISDLFEIKTSAKRINANTLSDFNGSYPYIARGRSNNGIKGFIDYDTKYLNEGNTISLGQDTATLFYQEKPYFTGDKIKIMKYKKGLFNEKIAVFYITLINKIFKNYQWGQDSFNVDLIGSIKIDVPLNTNNEIDHKFMEDYITAIEKMTIKSAMNIKDLEIETYKKVI